MGGEDRAASNAQAHLASHHPRHPVAMPVHELPPPVAPSIARQLRLLMATKKRAYLANKSCRVSGFSSVTDDLVAASHKEILVIDATCGAATWSVHFSPICPLATARSGDSD